MRHHRPEPAPIPTQRGASSFTPPAFRIGARGLRAAAAFVRRFASATRRGLLDAADRPAPPRPAEERGGSRPVRAQASRTPEPQRVSTPQKEPQATPAAQVIGRIGPVEQPPARRAAGPEPTPPAEGPGPLARGLAAARTAWSDRFGEVWWVGSTEPLTLHLPRGATVLVMAGVVGIIVMAFAVGRRSGRADAVVATPLTPAQRLLATLEPASDARGVPGIDAGGSVPGGAETPAGDAGPEGVLQAGTQEADGPRLQARYDAGLDPRVDGRNYLVYMTATRSECLRLADFLNERGVTPIVMRSGRSVETADGDGKPLVLPLYWVVDVGQGFSRAEYVRGEHRAFHEERMELGRAWKRHNGGRGSDLSDMQFYAYLADS
ncbi:hypothetical protein PSMK_16200 [Phycisphaera mikurensis NBRC 102666]|uniref:Uncharacterized protein n=2 Tax=Phycisphaera TaxID=666508 RepID=I0IEU1_PHYMF|nr:hypothetical protein PSMK_16200 [Phycisphaera mikurensis NBRC 102666]